MSLIRKHVAVLQAWACLDLVVGVRRSGFGAGDWSGTPVAGLGDNTRRKLTILILRWPKHITEYISHDTKTFYVIDCPLQCNVIAIAMQWTEYKTTLTCPMYVRRLWTRLWRYLWNDLHKIWNIASLYHTEENFF